MLEICSKCIWIFRTPKKATYGLDYKLTLTRNKDDTVWQKAEALADARIKIYHIHWYVPYYTPTIQQQDFLFEQFLSKTPTELRYTERSLFMEEVNIQNLWNFELGRQESMKFPKCFFVGFQERDRQDAQNLKNDSFLMLPVTSARCNIRTEKYPVAGILINYNDDDYRQCYAQIKAAFRALRNDDILQPYITDEAFRSSNAGLLRLVIVYSFSK